VPIRQPEGCDLLMRCFFKEKVFGSSENAYQAPKLREMGRQLPPSPLFLRKGEGKKHILLAAGPATSIGAFSWKMELFRWSYTLMGTKGYPKLG
jgi:hypothetical protein